MPILDIEIVGEPRLVFRRDLTERIAEAAATALQSRPRGTWVKLRVITPDDYAENEMARSETVRPVFVRVLLADPPDGEQLHSQSRALARAIGAACERAPEHVHIIYEPPARGRIAFGGELLE